MKLHWTIQVSVDESWVEDGFNPDKEQWAEIIRSGGLQYAYSHEVKCRILSKPDQKNVARLLGYKSVKQMKGDK